MNRFDQSISFHQAALNLRAQRQAVIASNIANADTPNYKARDIDFRTALSGALSGRVGPLALSTTTSGHRGGVSAATLPTLQYRRESQSSIDGNTVDVDAERAALAQNALYYEASITFINGMLRTMQSAIANQ